MPYGIRKTGDKWEVYKKTDPSKVFGTHDSPNEARAQIAAIRMSEAEKK